MTEIDIFPDTNILLHYPPLAQIDWLKVSDADSIRIVLCLEVIKELDKKKSEVQFASRASRALKEIWDGDSSGEELRTGVTVSIFNYPLRSGDFDENLSPEHGDDRIIHLVQQYQTQNPARNVVIVTEDVGMKARCKATGVLVIQLDSSTRLPIPQDELTKQNKQLSAELAALRSRQPKLHIRAANPKDRTNGPPTYKLTKSWQPVDVETKVIELVQVFPKYAPNQSGGQPAWMENAFQVRPISQEERAAYNEKVDKYVGKYAEYLECLNIVEDVKERTLYVELQLINDGTSIASDLDIVINWPEAVRQVAKKGSKDADLLELQLEEPCPPERPSPMRNLIDSLSPSTFRSIAALSPALVTGLRSRHEDDEPEVKCKSESEACQTHIRLKKIKHGHPRRLGTFLVSLNTWEDCKPIEVKYDLSASELPGKITGTIPLIVKVENES